MRRSPIPQAPQSSQPSQPPVMPFGCLRSADAIYELFERKTKIGRGIKCDVTLTSSKSISSAHCTIIFDGNQATLRDLNSTNGTFVNNVRVHNNTYPLETGDIIRFGCDVQSYRFESSQDMIEYEPRSKSLNKSLNSSKRRQKDRSNDSPNQRRRHPDRHGRPRTAAAGFSNHRVRRSDSPESRERGSKHHLHQQQQQRRRRPRTSGGMRRSHGENPEDDRDVGSRPTGDQSPQPPPNVPRVNHRRGVSTLQQSGDDVEGGLRSTDAYKEGERKGRLEAELEELRARLAESDGKAAGITQYRKEARALIRRSRHRAHAEGQDVEGQDVGDPDANMVAYRTAHGTVRERSPTRKRTAGNHRDSLEEIDAGDPFEYADARAVRRDENGNDVRVDENRVGGGDSGEESSSRESGSRESGSREGEHDDYEGEENAVPGRRRGGGRRGKRRPRKQWREGEERTEETENMENMENMEHRFEDSMDDEEEEGKVGHQGKRTGGLRRARSNPLDNRSASHPRRNELTRVDGNGSVVVERGERGERSSRGRSTARSEHGGSRSQKSFKKSMQPFDEGSSNDKQQRGGSSRRTSRQSNSQQSLAQDAERLDERLGGEEDEGEDEGEDEMEDDMDRLLMAGGGGGDESMPGGGDQSVPTEEPPVQTSGHTSVQTSVKEKEQERLIQALQERLAIAEETSRNTLQQMNLLAQQAQEDKAAGKAALAEAVRRANQPLSLPAQQVAPLNVPLNAPLNAPLNVPLNASPGKTTYVDGDVAETLEMASAPTLSLPYASDARAVRRDENGNDVRVDVRVSPPLPSPLLEPAAAAALLLEEDTTKEDKAIEESLMQIKQGLDHSMDRREELRKAIEVLTAKAVEAHVNKLERAEARHQEEVVAMVADTAAATSAAATSAVDSVEGETTVEGERQSNDVAKTSPLASLVPSLSREQLAQVDAASEREVQYMNELDTARDALDLMKQELAVAEEKQQQETLAMQQIALDVEQQHHNEIHHMEQQHQAKIMSMSQSQSLPRSQSSSQSSSSSSPVQRSEAEVVLESLRTDMEAHDEMSRSQMERLKQKLSDTERIHANQLQAMTARHRMELERAAVGSTAAAMIPAIIESATTLSTTTLNTLNNGTEQDGTEIKGLEGLEGNAEEVTSSSAINDALMTTRRAMLDLNQEAEEYARPSPTRQQRSMTTNVNVVNDMKELTDIARREHQAEIDRLKQEHRAQLKAALNSTFQQHPPSISTTPAPVDALVDAPVDTPVDAPVEVDAQVLALTRQVQVLTSRLEDAKSTTNAHEEETTLFPRDVARAAVLRPLVRNLHLDGLERGFQALNTERLRHLATQVQRNTRDQGAMKLHCIAKRGVSTRTRSILLVFWLGWLVVPCLFF